MKDEEKVKKIILLLMTVLLTMTFIPVGVYAAVSAEITNLQEEWFEGAEGIYLSTIDWNDGMTSGTMKSGEFILSSNNSQVFSCDEKNYCVPVKEGTATITAEAKDGSVIASKVVKVAADEGKKCTIQRVGDRKINIGPKGKKLKITSEAKDISVKWKSSNVKVAKVDQNGNVMPKSFGTVTISASTENGNTVKWQVTVNKLTISVKENKWLPVTTYVNNIKNYKKGKWSKSNSIAKIAENKLRTDAFLIGSKPIKTKTLTYTVGKVKYKLTVKVSCEHRFTQNTSYVKKCRDNAQKYYNDYLYYDNEADRYWGASHIAYLDKAIEALNKSNEWLQKGQNNYYKCWKCGTTKKAK